MVQINADTAKDLEIQLEIAEKGSIIKSKTRETGGTFRTGMHPWRSGEIKSIRIKSTFFKKSY